MSSNPLFSNILLLQGKPASQGRAAAAPLQHKPAKRPPPRLVGRPYQLPACRCQCSVMRGNGRNADCAAAHICIPGVQPSAGQAGGQARLLTGCKGAAAAKGGTGRNICVFPAPPNPQTVSGTVNGPLECWAGTPNGGYLCMRRSSLACSAAGYAVMPKCYARYDTGDITQREGSYRGWKAAAWFAGGGGGGKWGALNRPPRSARAHN